MTGQSCNFLVKMVSNGMQSYSACERIVTGQSIGIPSWHQKIIAQKRGTCHLPLKFSRCTNSYVVCSAGGAAEKTLLKMREANEVQHAARKSSSLLPGTVVKPTGKTSHAILNRTATKGRSHERKGLDLVSSSSADTTTPADAINSSTSGAGIKTKNPVLYLSSPPEPANHHYT